MNRISERIWNLAGFAARERNVLVERIGSSSAFLIFDRLVSHLFDYGLYPLSFLLADIYIGGYWGFTVAAVVMTTLSFLICWSWIYLYDFFEIDLLILEDVKRLRNNGSGDKSGPKALVAKILKKGNFLSFVAMSLKFDPFMTTVFMRLDDETFGLHGRRDWSIFVGSVILSNVYWWIPSFFIGTEGFSLVGNFLENVDWQSWLNFFLPATTSLLTLIALWTFLVQKAKT